MPVIGTSQTGLGRSANASGRVTIEAVDDTTLWQQGTHKGHQNEQADTIEHAHPYGFTSVTQPPTGDKKAEGVVVYPTGDRSHGVSIVNGDRRYRLYKLANGEVALHDDLGHQVHISRGGIVASAPNSKKIVCQIMVSDKLPQDQKYGQTAQIKQKVLASFQIDKTSVTVNHPGVVNLNAPTINLNGSTINLVGNVHLGSTGGVPAAQKGTIDTAGNADQTNLATKVWVT